ncbi:MAG: hypothetical protein QOD77_315 [Thermoplasmata archaeon]|jgi:hypothetical protein|nr:hypothetical protein [Thermoplasmata archaeon]
MQKLLFAAVAAVLVAFAGCAAPDLEGTVEPNRAHQQAAAGAATVVYQPFTGQNAAGGLPAPLNGTLQCGQGNLPPQVPADRCKGPYTDVKATFSGLPEPGSLAYTLKVVGVAEAVGTSSTGGNVSFAHNYTTDLSGQATGLQLWLGDFLYMTGAPNGGAFAFPTGVTGVTVQGAFVGSNAKFNVVGLPPSNETYMGRLYLPGAADAVEEFPVHNGDNEHVAKRPAAEYGEFHVHLGDSKLNLAKATFQVKDE